ncbi:hypothetical protein Bbelb_154080 [Branchiostoma belcheri]|nr:hypothetical protein Bbelb_154080 [Branchiostoma belcheri]
MSTSRAPGATWSFHKMAAVNKDGGRQQRWRPVERWFPDISTYEKECGKVKHTALPAPCCSALHNCVSPNGYEMEMGTTLRSGKSRDHSSFLYLPVLSSPHTGVLASCLVL